MTATMLLQLDRFGPDQRVAVVAEPLTVECPTCGGRGLGRQVWSGSKRRGRVGGNDGDCSVFPRCPTCPDDGSGNAVGTGRVPFTGRVAIAVPCDTCGGSGKRAYPSSAGRFGGAGGMTITHDTCNGPCNGEGHVIVASADVRGVVYAGHSSEHCEFSEDGHCEHWYSCEPCHHCGDDTIDVLCDCPRCEKFTVVGWHVLLDNVATVEERCVCGDLDGVACPHCFTDRGCAPIPVAAGDTFRKWEP